MCLAALLLKDSGMVSAYASRVMATTWYVLTLHLANFALILFYRPLNVGGSGPIFMLATRPKH